MNAHRLGRLVALWVVVLAPASHPYCHASEPVAADIVLRNGILVDGTGAARTTGDLAIQGDRIVAVGRFDVKGVPLTIHCTGLMIAPGFIDLHNHSDEQILKPETRANLNSLSQGCTTVVTGNCGAGPVDAAAFYEAVETHGAGTNIAHLLPQGSLRQEVVGLANRPATPEEIKAMRELACKAMQDGVWGMSTGLIYVPGSYADTDELVAIAEVVGEHGGIYASHMRDEGTQLLAAVEELLEIGRRAKLPAHASHFKSSGQDAWGLIRQAAKMIEQAKLAGQTVTADQYPYIASSTSLLATVIPTAARADGRDEFLKRLDDTEQGASIRAHIADVLRKKEDGTAIRIARYEERPEWVGRNLKDIAAAEGITPLDLCMQIARTGNAQIVNFCMSEDDVRFAMQIPWVATASDGRAAIPGTDRPHPRYYGTFARKIGYYSLREEVLPLEQAIYSCSGLPAEILKLPHRGVLKPDYFADVAVLDPTTYIDTATFDDPHQYAAGVRHLLVNGTLVIHEGYPTGALAGRALRHEPAKDCP
ncbi:MAG: amidohydrolase family protein [Planctomycetaceae bacterium]